MSQLDGRVLPWRIPMGEAWHWILTNPRAIVRMVAAAFAAYYFWRIWNSEDGDDDDDGGGGRRILKFLGLVDDDGEPERTRAPAKPSPTPHLP